MRLSLKGHSKGFTLLEVMVALAILAIAMAAITFANNASMLRLASTNRMVEASFLLQSIVEDIQSYYERKGFPSNSIEDRPCEVPPDFEDVFDCHYDLEAIELTPDAVTALAQAGAQSLMEAVQGGGEGLLGQLQQQGGGDNGGSIDLQDLGNQLKNANLSKLALLAPLFGPQGPQIMQLCGINLGMLAMGIGGMVQFLPMVIQKVSERVRKLTVHLTWKEGPKEGKELTIETFIVSLPEEEVQRLKEMQEMNQMRQQMMEQNMPGSSAPNFNKKGVPNVPKK